MYWLSLSKNEMAARLQSRRSVASWQNAVNALSGDTRAVGGGHELCVP